MRNMLLIAAAALAMGTSAVSAAPVSESDKMFLTKEVQGSSYEMAIAKLATQKATKAPIKAYSRKIVADHTSANGSLMRLVKSKGMTAPTDMSSDDQGRLAKLQAASGPAFDKAYVDEITRINSEDTESSKRETASTKDAQIKGYVAQMTKMDAAHTKMGAGLKSVVS